MGIEWLDFHFDVMCPWAYQTSRWMREVRDLTGLDVRWKFFSLEEINRVEGRKHPWEREWSYGWSMMRIGALLRRDDPAEPHTMGFDLRRPWQDLWRGVLLAAAIGLPGLALYAAAKALDLNTTIAAANLAGAWWTIPVLVLAAAQNAVLEEVVMVGYLFSRWGSVGWGKWRIILTSALIRGSYHLYQGFGGFVGNLVMGIIFGWFYTRTKRVMPLVVAHTILDVVAFVGYALLKSRLGWL